MAAEAEKVSFSRNRDQELPRCVALSDHELLLTGDQRPCKGLR